MNSRLLQSVNKHIEGGHHYDAHQLIRTVYSRLCAKDQHDEAIKLCTKFGDIFALHEQYDLVAELGTKLVKALKDKYNKNEEELSYAVVNDEYSSRLLNIFNLCPNKSVKEKFTFMNQALHISRSDRHPDGYIEFHLAIGKAYMGEENFGKASLHLVYCGDVSLLSTLLVQWRPYVYRSERDLLLLRLVLMLLSRGSIKDAKELVSIQCEDMDSTTTAPAHQLAYLITESCLYKDINFFNILKSKYALVLRRENSLNTLVSCVETKVLGVSEQQGGLFTMLTNLFGTPQE
eukprot:GHVR01117182.1.p1 GENE.GHVR01117182.1~~GHVR01117182.1.p1  ORF type:complete len:290 (+),score=55.32 GHVR01117182.1:25-894(+)